MGPPEGQVPVLGEGVAGGQKEGVCGGQWVAGGLQPGVGWGELRSHHDGCVPLKLVKLQAPFTAVAAARHPFEHTYVLGLSDLIALGLSQLLPIDINLYNYCVILPG